MSMIIYLENKIKELQERQAQSPPATEAPQPPAKRRRRLGTGSSEATHEQDEDRNSQPLTFPKFPYFPYEIRAMIWKAAVSDPQVLRCHDNWMTYQDDEPDPPLSRCILALTPTRELMADTRHFRNVVRACREARDEALPTRKDRLPIMFLGGIPRPRIYPLYYDKKFDRLVMDLPGELDEASVERVQIEFEESPLLQGIKGPVIVELTTRERFKLWRAMLGYAVEPEIPVNPAIPPPDEEGESYFPEHS